MYTPRKSLQGCRWVEDALLSAKLSLAAFNRNHTIAVPECKRGQTWDGRVAPPLSGIWHLSVCHPFNSWLKSSSSRWQMSFHSHYIYIPDIKKKERERGENKKDNPLLKSFLRTALDILLSSYWLLQNGTKVVKHSYTQQYRGSLTIKKGERIIG